MPTRGTTTAPRSVPGGPRRTDAVRTPGARDATRGYGIGSRPAGSGAPTRPRSAIGGSVRVVDRGSSTAPGRVRASDLYDRGRPSRGRTAARPDAAAGRPTTTKSLVDRYRPAPGARPRSDAAANPASRPRSGDAATRGLPSDARAVDGRTKAARPNALGRPAVDRYIPAKPTRSDRPDAAGRPRATGATRAATRSDATAGRGAAAKGSRTAVRSDAPGSATLTPRPNTPRATSVPVATPPRLSPHRSSNYRPNRARSLYYYGQRGYYGSCYGPIWDPCYSWGSSWNPYWSCGLTWSLGCWYGSFGWGWNCYYPWRCYTSYRWWRGAAWSWWTPYYDPFAYSVYAPTVYVEPSVVYVEPQPAVEPAAEAVGGAVGRRALTPEEEAVKYVDLGDFYFREGRYSEAAQAYGRARSLTPNDATIHFVLADAVFAGGDYHFAAFLIGEALRLDPELAWAEADKRLLYGDPADFDQQLQTLLRYLEEKPYDAMAHLVLGYNLKFSGKPDQALAAFRRVLEIDPESVAAQQFVTALTTKRPAAAERK